MMKIIPVARDVLTTQDSTFNIQAAIDTLACSHYHFVVEATAREITDNETRFTGQG